MLNINSWHRRSEHLVLNARRYPVVDPVLLCDLVASSMLTESFSSTWGAGRPSPPSGAHLRKRPTGRETRSSPSPTTRSPTSPERRARLTWHARRLHDLPQRPLRSAPAARIGRRNTRGQPRSGAPSTDPASLQRCIVTGHRRRAH